MTINTNLCIHCSNNRGNVCKVDNEKLPEKGPFTTRCNCFEQKTYPYCPHCGTPYTLINGVLDPDTPTSYTEDITTFDHMLAMTCLSCGETSLIEDIPAI